MDRLPLAIMLNHVIINLSPLSISALYFAIKKDERYERLADILGSAKFWRFMSHLFCDYPVQSYYINSAHSMRQFMCRRVPKNEPDDYDPGNEIVRGHIPAGSIFTAEMTKFNDEKYRIRITGDDVPEECIIMKTLNIDGLKKYEEYIQNMPDIQLGRVEYYMGQKQPAELLNLPDEMMTEKLLPLFDDNILANKILKYRMTS